MISKWAERYVKKLGFHIVPIEPMRKFPREQDWGKNAISNPLHARAFYESRTDWNVGVALGASRVCSLDIDHAEWFDIICDAFSIDKQLLFKEFPTIKGRGYRVMFRVPEGVNLPYLKLNWHPESDPTGEKHRKLLNEARKLKQQANAEKDDAKRDELLKKRDELREQAKPFAMKTVFELRAACDGSQKQDILPPSVHPETGKPYEWITPPANDLPEPPAWLLAVWLNFDSFRKQFLLACPWAVEEKIYKEEIAKPLKVREYSSDGGLVQAANAYAQNVSIINELNAQGYTRKGKRFLSPYSSTNLAGVTVFKASNKCWIHHASDPLCSDSSGKPVSSFDLYCEYVHGGKFVEAARAAAERFNIAPHAPRYTECDPAPVIQQERKPTQTQTETQSASFSVDYLAPLPWNNSNERPIKHIDNLKEIMKRCRITVRYNVMRKEEEIIIPYESFMLDNESNASLAYLDSMCSLFDYPTDKNSEFLTYLADKNAYSPVVEWVSSKKWDGVDRFSVLCDTVHAVTPSELKRTLIKRWMISAIAAAFSPTGVSAQGVLVFQGEQNLGKTTWVENLVPKTINDKTKMIKTGVLLKPDDKDSVKQANSAWIVELGELDGSMKKSDDAQFKAFVTRHEDTFRRPYARKESTYARRTVYFGSVNPREFLRDDTGNRRFWTIECTKLDSRHDIDMQQCWAQVYEMWKAGEHHWLTAEEIKQLEDVNFEHRAADPVEDRIQDSFDWIAPKASWRYISTTEALLEIGIDRPTRADTTKAGMVLARLNDNERKTAAGGRRLTLVPPLISSYYKN